MLTKNIRHDIRREGWKNVKRKFFLNILIMFIVSIVVNGGYQFATRSQTDINDSTVAATASLMQENMQNVDTEALESGDVEAVNEAVNKAVNDAVSESISGLAGRDTSQGNAQIINKFIMNLFGIKVPDYENISTTSANFYGGVASVFVNEITGSQSFIFGIVNGINEIAFNGRVASSIVIFIFAILSILLFVFVKNVIVVGKNRYFLEQRRYSETGPGELLFPYKNKRLKNISRVMFFRYIFQVLWNLTIVGGFIKHYEYLLIPYIMAENPETPRKDAFAISRQLMQGEKWKVFLIDFALIPWDILSYLTFSLSGLFFSDAYFECVKAEVYMRIREMKKDSLPLGLRKWLNDDMLAIDHVENTPHPSGLEVLDLPQMDIHKLKYDYMRNYSLLSLVQLFFTYSFVGWLWEVALHLATEGSFVNRGTMHGPWLPIYGCGGILIIVLLRPLREKPGLLFAGAVGLCGIVEYATAWALETFMHRKWWDYTGYFLNIHGRVCFEGLLVFGMAGMAFSYVFSPMLDDLYQRVPEKKRKIICAILVVIFLADLVWMFFSPNTGEGIST